MRGMKREIGAKKKKRLVAVIVIALILAAISFLLQKPEYHDSKDLYSIQYSF